MQNMLNSMAKIICENKFRIVHELMLRWHKIVHSLCKHNKPLMLKYFQKKK